MAPRFLSRENNAYTNQLRRRDHLRIRRAVLIEIIDMFDSDILPDDMSYVSTVGHMKHQSTTLIGEIAGRKLQPQSSRVVKRLGSWKIDPFFFLPFKDIKGSIKKSLHHSFALDLVPLSLPFLLFFWGSRRQHPRIALPPDWQRGSRFGTPTSC